MLKQFILFFFVYFSCFCSSADSAENVALGKSYTFLPKPNYPLCTDDSDLIQLTDGKSLGSQWTNKSTVGWRRPEQVVEIVIDLGRGFAVGEVRIHTVGGGIATVEFPEFAAVLLSDNGREFKFAGFVSSRELENIRGSGYRGVPHMISVRDINAAGRYVKLVMRPKGFMLFIDEVEIFGENISSAGKQNLRNGLEIIETNDKLLNSIEDYLQLENNLTATVESVNRNRVKLSAQARNKILVDLENPAHKANNSAKKLFSVIQVREKKERIGKSRSEIYREIYNKPFVCLPADPMEIVFEKEMLLREGPKNISIRMRQNEYESAAFNIINCSSETMKMFVSISPLSGPEGQIHMPRSKNHRLL